ncbi:hypothetical protein [Nocardia cyriacigeorgica]|uniref:hypothetical protein n=1 Tax=Nocardia cyriacigeorgica TaxID=135487 RepID=UPI00158E1065|nr:hypothetical protein [Nocardia cyriacigeorgica]
MSAHAVCPSSPRHSRPAAKTVVHSQVAGAIRTEPELADVYDRARKLGDRTRTEVFASWPDGTLRAGLDIATATDIYAAMCTIDVYTTFTVERGWPPERVERWWGEALARELLAR